MFKYIFSKAVVYIIILVFVVPIIIFLLIGNASRKQMKDNAFATPAAVASGPNVPLPSKEDIVRTFCELINEGKISDAVGMMDINDDAVKQSWGVYLNNFSSFKLISIGKSKIDESGNSFEADIDVTLKENLTDLPIPNYGWENGLNKRWINVVEKEKGMYKISEIATGP
jgi:hypothetical protein